MPLCSTRFPARVRQMGLNWTDGMTSERDQKQESARRYIAALASERAAGEKLPSVRYLAEQSGFSRTTLSAAARWLHQAGVIVLSPRSGMRKPGSPKRFARRVSSVERVYAMLCERLRDGLYYDGSPLPKRGAIAAECRVSEHTVSAAYQRLERESLVYRRGKFWVVGKKTVQKDSDQKPIILLLVQGEHSWRGLQRSERTGAFCRMFLELLQVNGVYMEPAFFDKRHSPSEFFAGGAAEIDARIRDLGNRYVGALIIEYDTLNPFAPDSFALRLTAHTRPVVCLDRHGAAASPPRRGRLATLCQFSERRAVRLALETLYSRGHAKIGFPVFWPERWRIHRKGLVLEESKRFKDMRIITNEHVEDLIRLNSKEHIASTLYMLQDRGFPEIQLVFSFLIRVIERRRFAFTRSGTAQRLTHKEIALLLQLITDPENKFAPAHKYLLRLTALMVHFLGDKRPTALLAPCDQDALPIYYWLQAARIAVPSQMSLLSFDNYTELMPMPVSTIDFGFDHLGFCAFHLLMDDGVVRRPMNSTIFSKPHLIDRGSIGTPAGEKS